MASNPDVSSNPADTFNQRTGSVPVEPQEGKEPEQTPKCGVCREAASKELKTLECVLCKKVFHYKCATYSPEKLQEVFEKNGWICINCFLCGSDSNSPEKDCMKCQKPISKESKTLECRRCNKVYHHECAANPTKEHQDMLEKMGWLCTKCFICDEKEQKCCECEKLASSQSRILVCKKCEKLFHYECAAYGPEKLQRWFENNGWLCRHCLIGPEEEGTSTWKKIGKHVAISAGLTALCLGGIPLAVGALGFGAAGVASGSLAAAYQSAFLGGHIAAGGMFAVLQSIGATGLATTTQAAIAGACAGAPFLSKLKWKKS